MKFNKKSIASDTTEKTSVPEVNEEELLTANKLALSEYINQANGIAKYLLNTADVQLFQDRDFIFKFEPKLSKGHIYLNIIIYDKELLDQEKNEVDRICVAKAVNGEAEVNSNFSALMYEIKRKLYAYVIDKRLNYWNRSQAETQGINLDELALAA